MCGIAGILHHHSQAAIDEDQLRRMLSLIRHRGPDESGIYIDPWIGMGSVRLSIIDIAGGTQPISNEDGRLWIVYNGEIFNFPELRQDLVNKGHTFSTQSDTEVILHLYEQEGVDCFQKLNGEFALAIWDSLRRELVLARDRFGIRPLFYARTKQGLVFASEIKSLLIDPGVSRDLDLKSLAQVFTVWSPLTPRTIFQQVQAVPPGHYLILQPGKGVQAGQYWHNPLLASDESPFPSREEALESLREILLDAVRIRLRADVPVGSYLSGGLDSSLIAALVRKYVDNNLQTFSMGFAASGFDETGYQEVMSDQLGTQHNRMTISTPDILRNLPQLIRHCEVPLLRTAPVPLYQLSAMVRDKGLKVVLTGEGADEIFAGYNIFKEAKIRAFCARRPESGIRPMLLQRLYPYVFTSPGRGRATVQQFFQAHGGDIHNPLFSHQVRWANCRRNLTFFSPEVMAELDGYDVLRDVQEGLPSGMESLDVVSRAQILETDIFMSNYLLSSQGDRPAMAHSVEIRLPFLDCRVVEAAARVPRKWMLPGLKEKQLLKGMARGLVPESIRKRPKQPYRAPIHELFGGGCVWPESIKQALSEEGMRRAGVFDCGKVAKLVAKYGRAPTGVGSEVQDMALMGILTTQLVYEQFVAGRLGYDCEAMRVDRRIIRAGMG